MPRLVRKFLSMPKYIEMPKLSDTMTEGTLVKWRKKEGDKVATGDVLAQVISDPKVLFRVQANGSTPIGLADIGTNANFAVGTPAQGNTASGISYATLNQGSLSTNATLQFRIVALVQDPPGDNGTDITAANNHVLVKLNNSDFNVAAGI